MFHSLRVRLTNFPIHLRLCEAFFPLAWASSIFHFLFSIALLPTLHTYKQCVHLPLPAAIPRYFWTTTSILPFRVLDQLWHFFLLAITFRESLQVIMRTIIIVLEGVDEWWEKLTSAGRIPPFQSKAKPTMSKADPTIWEAKPTIWEPIRPCQTTTPTNARRWRPRSEKNRLPTRNPDLGQETEIQAILRLEVLSYAKNQTDAFGMVGSAFDWNGR